MDVSTNQDDNDPDYLTATTSEGFNGFTVTIAKTLVRKFENVSDEV